VTEWLKEVPAVWIILGLAGNAAITWWQTRQHAEMLKDLGARLHALEEWRAYQKGLQDGQA
jgi:hypothetical protein